MGICCGRQPTGGELYAAHFLGPAGCARLIEAREANPAASAVSLFPDAASANRSIFYRAGRPASVDEVYANLMRHHGETSMSVDEIAPTLDQTSAAPVGEREATLSAALARIRAQQAMVSMILGQGGDGWGGTFGERRESPSMLSGYSSQIAAMLSPTRDGDSR